MSAVPGTGPAARDPAQAGPDPSATADPGETRPDPAETALEADAELAVDEPAVVDEPAEVSEPGGGTILTDVAALAAERDEYLGALQRMKADFDNYRKRVLRQQEEQAARAAGTLVTKLLPVLDNLDLAWAHLGDGKGDEITEEARALDQARRQLLDVLAKEGLERVDEVEVPFDPTVHDAVAHGAAPDADSGPDDGEGHDAHEVDEVMRAGYRWRGQVLRPAMVRVRG